MRIDTLRGLHAVGLVAVLRTDQSLGNVRTSLILNPRREHTVRPVVHARSAEVTRRYECVTRRV